MRFVFGIFFGRAISLSAQPPGRHKRTVRDTLRLMTEVARVAKPLQ